LYPCFGNNSFDFDTLPDNIVAVVREISINGDARRPLNNLASALIIFPWPRNIIVDYPNITGALSMSQAEMVKRSFHLQQNNEDSSNRAE
jgi:hypothetical protein